MLGEESRHREGREKAREESVVREREVLEGKRDNYILYLMILLECLLLWNFFFQ